MRKVLFSIIKVVVPLTLIYYIFTIIDFDQFLLTLKRSNNILISLVILSVPSQYLFFTIRWKIVMKLIENVKTKVFQLHNILYKGLFVGFFFPGGVGVDVYRVISVKKKYGIYKSNISSIFLEKLFGTASSLLLIICCYPFLGVSDNKIISMIISYLYIFLGVFILLIVLISFKSNFIRGKFALFLRRFSLFLNVRIIHLINRISKSDPIDQGEDIVQDIIKPLLSLKYIAIVVCFSIAILVVKSCFMNIVFVAIGYDMPLVVNLFVVPLVNIISLIPISFGGVGVRESSTIALYGFFGIPAEASLIVSIITFTFLLLNISSGGLLMMIDNIRKR